MRARTSSVIGSHHFICNIRVIFNQNKSRITIYSHCSTAHCAEPVQSTQAPGRMLHSVLHRHMLACHCCCIRISAGAGLGRQEQPDLRDNECTCAPAWLRCLSDHSRQPYHKELGPPDPRCLSYTHDRDYGKFKTYAADPITRQAKKKAWCPPERACYDSMEPAGVLNGLRFSDRREL